MSKSTTKKAAAAKAPEPMDPSIAEAPVGQAAPNAKRNAYALVTLVDEVRTLFPETSYEFTNYNGRNTALGVSFDMTSLHSDDAADLKTLLYMTGSDHRVNEIITEDDQILILLAPSARTQDVRDPFGLINAHAILTADEEDTL